MSSAGKGDRRRPYDPEVFREGWERTFTDRGPWRKVGISTGPILGGARVVGYEVVAAACPMCGHDKLSETTRFGDERPSYICQRCYGTFTAPDRLPDGT